MKLTKYRHDDYERSPAEGRCNCGKMVILDDPLDNQCDCGRCYNSGGQEVTPSWECDEQGNPYADFAP
jgi:hypothetical protein